MPDLLHPRERDLMLAYLRRLLRRTPVDGRPLAGLAHSEAPGAPLLTLDNAVAAEALAIPALRDAEPALAEATLGFVLAMGDEPGAPPRGAVPGAATGRVELRRADPRDLHVTTPWHEFTGDLVHGVLRQRLRGETEGRAVLHTGNMVRLRPGGGGIWGLLARLSPRARTLDVEEAVSAQGVQAEGDGVLMYHESALRLRPVPRLGWTISVGTVRYEYRVGPVDPVLRLAVTLRAAPGIALLDARVTTALDALSEHAPGFGEASIGRSGAQSRRDPVPYAEEEALAEGPLESLHLWQSGPAAEALALHLRPREPEAVRSARVHARDGVPHWVVLRHSVPRLAPGGVATLREDRLLARGMAPGAPEAAARLLRAPDGLGGRDPGRAGVGAPLAAVAAALLTAPAFAVPLSRERTGRLGGWLESQLAAVLPEGGDPVLPVGELAAVVLALEAVARASGLPRDTRRLRQCVGRLVEAASAEGVIGAGLLEHGAALLALAGAVTLVPEPRLEAALRRAVLALRSDGPSLAGMPMEGVPTTRALAAVLRGVRAARLAESSEAVSLGEEASARAEAVVGACLEALSSRLRAHGEWLEVLAAPDSETGDALSQAAVLLAVLSPDEAALAMARVEA